MNTDLFAGSPSPSSPSAREALLANVMAWGSVKADCRKGQDAAVTKLLQKQLAAYFDRATEQLKAILAQNAQSAELEGSDTAVSFAEAVIAMMDAVALHRVPGTAMTWMMCRAKAELVKPMVAASESEEKLMPLITELTKTGDLITSCETKRQELLTAIQRVRASRDPDKAPDAKMVAATEGLFQHIRDKLLGDDGTDDAAIVRLWTDVLSELLPFVAPEGREKKRMLVDHL
eukprot:5524588-Pyramimonas_sp.AAC.1